MPWNDLSQTVKLLALLGRTRPEVFDAFPPHDPGVLSRFDAVALNPQPIPPGRELVTSAIFTARRLAQLAVEAEVRGEESGGGCRRSLTTGAARNGRTSGRGLDRAPGLGKDRNPIPGDPVPIRGL